VQRRRRNRPERADSTGAPQAPPAPPAPIRAQATLAEFARTWLKERPPRQRQADTERLRNHVLGPLGARRLRELTAEDVTETVRQLLAKKGMSVKSARNAYATFAELLGDALARGVLREDPRQLPADIWPAEDAGPKPVFSAAEVAALTHSERLGADQRLYNYLAFYTGRPTEELCRLRFSDVPALLGDAPPPELEAAIEGWRAHGFEAVYGRPPADGDWLVPRRANPAEPHSDGSAFKAFRRACVTLEIKTRSPHAIQNTFEELTARGPSQSS
jgi:integrase